MFNDLIPALYALYRVGACPATTMISTSLHVHLTSDLRQRSKFNFLQVVLNLLQLLYKHSHWIFFWFFGVRLANYLYLKVVRADTSGRESTICKAEPARLT